MGPVVAFCVVSDFVLLASSVAGVGMVLERWPILLPVMRWCGGLFVMGYGIHAAYRALRPSIVIDPGQDPTPSRARTLAVLAGLTLLNPHLYLDMMLMGTLANRHSSTDRWWYFAGLYAASLRWFIAIGYGAAVLRPLFDRPRSWQILDSVIAVVLLVLGTAVILSR